MLCLLRQRAVRTEIWVGWGVEVAGRGCLLDGRVQGHASELADAYYIQCSAASGATSKNTFF